MRPMFGQIALSVLAVRENNYGQRLGAARKAGSFEGTLPRPFSLRRARRGFSCGYCCDGQAENCPCLAQAACCANSQLADSNATSVCAVAEIIREVLVCARLSARVCPCQGRIRSPCPCRPSYCKPCHDQPSRCQPCQSICLLGRPATDCGVSRGSGSSCWGSAFGFPRCYAPGLVLRP